MNSHVVNRQEVAFFLQSFQCGVGTTRGETTELAVNPRRDIQRNPQTNYSLNQFKCDVYMVQSMIKLLKDRCKFLSDNVSTLTSNEWQLNWVEIENMKVNLVTLMSKLTKCGVVETMKRKLNRGRKKRCLRKRKKEVERENADTVEQSEREQSKDSKRRSNYMTVENELKRNEDLKAETDILLNDIRRKISETRKVKQRIHLLEKFRNVKKDKTNRIGLYTSKQSDEDFEGAINKLKLITDKQIESYTAEEESIKLRTKKADTNDLINGGINQQMNSEYEMTNEDLEILTCLFGCKSQTIDTPAYLEKSLHTEEAHQSFANMITNRKKWDKFLSHDGTCIPVEWVKPPEPALNWAKYLSQS